VHTGDTYPESDDEFSLYFKPVNVKVNVGKGDPYTTVTVSGTNCRGALVIETKPI
jgi:hypothetical protein